MTEQLIDGDLAVRQHGDRYLLVNESDWPVAEMYNEQEAEQLTKEHNSHHSLIAERERLVEALRRARAAAQIRSDLNQKLHGRPTSESWVPLADELLTTIDQKGSGSE